MIKPPWKIENIRFLLPLIGCNTLEKEWDHKVLRLFLLIMKSSIQTHQRIVAIVCHHQNLLNISFWSLNLDRLLRWVAPRNEHTCLSHDKESGQLHDEVMSMMACNWNFYILVILLVILFVDCVCINNWEL